jgi:hypothetical protein
MEPEFKAPHQTRKPCVRAPAAGFIKPARTPMIADGLCMPPTAGRRHRPKGVESPLLREEIEQFVLYARARYPERWHQKKIIGIAQDLYGSAATLGPSLIAYRAYDCRPV